MEKHEVNINIIIDIVKDILSIKFNEIQITKDTTFIQLGFDSMQFIELLLKLEEKLQVDLEDIVSQIDVGKLVTINDVSQIIGKFV